MVCNHNQVCIVDKINTCRIGYISNCKSIIILGNIDTAEQA